MSKRAGECSAAARVRVVKAREKQSNRTQSSKIGCDKAVSCNAAMKAKELKAFCEMDDSTKDLLKAAINQFSLSGRGYDRILKVSRTIADLESAENIEMHHVAEAINYRSFDRKMFG